MPAVVTNGALADLLALLDGVKEKMGYWIARCPAHEDNMASLSITGGRDGRVLLKCHAGCSAASIVEAVGLTMGDLFSDKEQRVKPNGATSPNGSAATGRAAMVKSYDYTDRDGQLLFQVCRFELPKKAGDTKPKKTFKQRRPDGQGGYTWGLGDLEPVLYRWPDVAAAVESGRPVYIVEGEKDADTLADLGYAATTNPMGALKWREEHSAALSGAEVVILPDNDEPGKAHAEQIAASLHARGSTVRLVALPGLGPKQDVSDWLAAGHTLDELEAVIGASRLWTPDTRSKALWRLDEILNNDDLMRPPAPVIPRMAWAGRSTMLAAGIKTGKSTLTGFLAAQISLPGGMFLGEPCAYGAVLIVGLEEALGDIGRRLRHFGADPLRCHVVAMLPADPHERPQQLTTYIDQLRPMVVVIDTLGAYSRGLVESENDNMQMQAVVQELTDIAHRTSVAMMINHHNKKAGGFRGASSIGGAVDSIIEIEAPDEKNDPTMRKARCIGRMPVHDFEFRYNGREYTLANQAGVSPIQRVLDYVRANPRVSRTRVREAIGGRAETVDAALEHLCGSSYIRDTGDQDRHAYEASTAAPARVI